MASTVDELLLQLKVDLVDLNTGLKTAEKRVETFSDKVEKNIASKFKELGLLMAGVFSVQLIKSIADISSQFQLLETRLIATTGSTTAAAGAMEFLRATAEKQSASIFDIADGYNRLIPAVNSGVISMDEMQHILVLANDNIKAFGLNSSEAQGLFLGLSQVLGSGTVTMEDLRQVTDRLPGSLNAMASAAGISVNQFKSLVATGKVTADMITSSLVTAFEKNEGAAEAMANTVASSSQRMENALVELAAEIGKSGLNDAMIGVADAITLMAQSAIDALPHVKNYLDFITDYMPLFRGIKEGIAAVNEQIVAHNALTDEALKKPKIAFEFGDNGGDTAKKAPNKNPLADLIAEEEKKDAEKAALKAAKKQEILDNELIALQESLMTQADLEDVHFAERLERITQFNEMGMITDAEYNKLSEEEQIRHMDEMKKISEQGEMSIQKFKAMSYKDQAKTIFGELANITAGVAQHNRALFEANKIAGIANAIINGYEGVSKTLAMYPFPLNVGMAAAHAAAAFAQVNAIRSTSFGGGGGGSAPSIGGSTPAPPVSPTSGGGGGDRNTRMSISGVGMNDIFTGAQVRSLIGLINDEVEDGAQLKGISVG